MEPCHHDHDGGHNAASANMDTITTTMMNHVHHVMKQQANASSMHSVHGHASGHGHANSHDMMSMAMTFHGGFSEKILFEQWNPQTLPAFVGSWLIIFLVAVLYEGLKTIRDHLAKRDARCQCKEESERQPSLLNQPEQQPENPNSNTLLPTVRTNISHRNKRSRARILSLHHILQTVLHILQMGISYLLMLVAMTFNVYLFFAVILGAGLGHFLFGWRRMSVIDYNEHCQ